MEIVNADRDPAPIIGFEAVVVDGLGTRIEVYLVELQTHLNAVKIT